MVELFDDDPQEDSLRDHPVHGKGFVEDGFRHVNNYGDPFIRARDAPPQVWPVNARDWGFQEWLPSRTDMTPDILGLTHPVVRINYEGEEEVGNEEGMFFAAFYYTAPGRPVCGDRRSCRYTHWTIDPDTDEAVMGQCWGCRRMGLKCTMENQRFPRRAFDGDQYIDDDNTTPLPLPGIPKTPRNWKPHRMCRSERRAMREMENRRARERRRRRGEDGDEDEEDDDDNSSDGDDNDEDGDRGGRGPGGGGGGGGGGDGRYWRSGGKTRHGHGVYKGKSFKRARNTRLSRQFKDNITRSRSISTSQSNGRNGKKRRIASADDDDEDKDNQELYDPGLDLLFRNGYLAEELGVNAQRRQIAIGNGDGGRAEINNDSNQRGRRPSSYVFPGRGQSLVDTFNAHGNVAGPSKNRGERATITEIDDGDEDKPDIEIDADHQDETDVDDDTGIVFIRFGKRASGTAEEPSIVEGL